MADIPIELDNLLNEGPEYVRTSFYTYVHAVKRLQADLDDRDKTIAQSTAQIADLNAQIQQKDRQIAAIQCQPKT